MDYSIAIPAVFQNYEINIIVLLIFIVPDADITKIQILTEVKKI